MVPPVLLLNEEHKTHLRSRYSGGRYPVPDLSVGTVRDYCDSADHVPFLPSAQGDLKDLQRPWTVKALLSLVPAGGHLLEIGGGQPLVAGVLAELGYTITLLDPYDGSGNGPVEYERYLQEFPHVRIVRRLFEPGVPEIDGEQFDAIYSVSVLEHVPAPALPALFAAVRAHLRPGGCSLHAVDCVLEGDGDAFHLAQCANISRHQAALARTDPAAAAAQCSAVLADAGDARNTYFLSAEGHNRWRGAVPYEDFPFRKVLSMQSWARKTWVGPSALVDN